MLELLKLKWFAPSPLFLLRIFLQHQQLQQRTCCCSCKACWETQDGKSPPWHMQGKIKENIFFSFSLLFMPSRYFYTVPMNQEELLFKDFCQCGDVEICFFPSGPVGADFRLLVFKSEPLLRSPHLPSSFFLHPRFQ